MTPLHVQKGTEQIVKWLTALSADTGIQPSGQMMPLVTQVFAQFQHFLRVDGDGAAEVYGADAMKILIERLNRELAANKFTKEVGPTIAKFRWLVPAEVEKETMRVCALSIAAGRGKDLKKAPAKKDGVAAGAGASSGGKKKDKSEDKSMATAMAYLS